jgi:hypothetical protein
MAILAARNAPQSPAAAAHILRLIERLAYIRALGLDRARADMIPALTFDRLADEGSRITPQHLGELNPLRRHATLAATGIRLEESLTDAALTMFDKLLGSMVRRAENRTRDKALKTVRELQGHLRMLTGSCRLLIDAHTRAWICWRRSRRWTGSASPWPSSRPKCSGDRKPSIAPPS